MDFTFTEEQQAAAEAVRGPVAEDFDRALWRKLTAADLLGLLAAPRYGGSGLDAVALCLVLRETGRVLARVPLLEHSAAAPPLQAYADESPRAALLPPHRPRRTGRHRRLPGPDGPRTIRTRC